MRKVLAPRPSPRCCVAGCGAVGLRRSCGGSSSTFAAVPTSDRSGQMLSIYGFGTGDDVAVNRAARDEGDRAGEGEESRGAYNPQAS